MRVVSGVVLCGLCVALSVGCTKPSESGARPAAGSGAKKVVIAMIPKSLGAEFWETVEAGARKAAAERNVEMKWEGPLTETEIAEQNKIIENMVTMKVNGIALAPLNPKAQRGAVEAAVGAGVPVVIFDSAVDGNAHTSYVATDNKRGGAMGAEFLAKALGGKGKVFLMRFIQGTASTEQRAEGFLEAAKTLGLEVVSQPYAEDATVAGCKKTAANALEGHVHDGKLEIDGIFACNDRANLGMLDALDDLRKQGVEVHAKYVGFDFGPTLIQALKENRIDALVAQNPRKMGYLAVMTLVDHLEGKPVEPVIDTGVELVTADRLQEPAIRELFNLGK